MRNEIDSNVSTLSPPSMYSSVANIGGHYLRNRYWSTSSSTTKPPGTTGIRTSAVDDAPSFSVAKLMQPLYSAIAPPHLRSSYSSENLSGQNQSYHRRQPAVASIRNFWPAMTSSTVEDPCGKAPDLSSYKGGRVAAIVKKQKQQQKKSSSQHGRRKLSSSSNATNATVGSSHRDDAVGTTAAAAPASPRYNASAPRIAMTSSGNVTPKPWTSAASTDYWRAANKDGGAEFSDTSSVATSFMAPSFNSFSPTATKETFKNDPSTFHQIEIAVASPMFSPSIASTAENAECSDSTRIRTRDPSIVEEGATKLPDQASTHFAPKFHSFSPISPPVPPAPSHWGTIKTGMVSHRVRSMSYAPPSSSVAMATVFADVRDNRDDDLKRRFPQQPENFVKPRRVVTKLARHFETGDTDQAGPLKLYHTQAYKRELQKISVLNSGGVMMKALRFEKPSGRSSSLAVTCVLFDAGDASRLEDASRQTTRQQPRRRRSQFDEENASYDTASSSYASSASVDATTHASPSGVDASLYPALSSFDVRRRIGSGLASRHESFLQAVSKSSHQPYHHPPSYEDNVAVATVAPTPCSTLTITRISPGVDLQTPKSQDVSIRSSSPAYPAAFLTPDIYSTPSDNGSTTTLDKFKMAADEATADVCRSSATTRSVSVSPNIILSTSFLQPNIEATTKLTLRKSTGSGTSAKERKKKAVSFSNSTESPSPLAVVADDKNNHGDFVDESSRPTIFSANSPVSDEQLQEIDRKTRRGSYIMATTANVAPDGFSPKLVGNGGARTSGATFSSSTSLASSTVSSSKREAPNTASSTNTLLSFSTQQSEDGRLANADNNYNNFIANNQTVDREFINNDQETKFNTSKFPFTSTPTPGGSIHSSATDGTYRRSFIATDGSVSPVPSPTVGYNVNNKQARMQRIMNFFSGDQQFWNAQVNEIDAQPLGVCSTSPSTSKSILNNNLDFQNGAGSVSSLASTATRTRDVLKFSQIARQAPLVHKQTMAADGRRSTERVWKHYYALLHGSTLYLFKERPVFDQNGEVKLTDDVVAIDVESCIADIAYDYVKRKNVFRITTQTQCEHLLQSEDAESMLKWLECFQRCNSIENNPNALSSSMALIIKRYEAQSQSVSPSVKPRRFLKAGGKAVAEGNSSAKDSPTLSSSSVVHHQDQQHQQHLHHNSCSDIIGNTTISSALAASSASSSFSVQSDKMEKHEKGDTTPNKGRKWRKVRKSGSCPVPTLRGKDGLNPDSMFGQMIDDCPTSGENDFVPLIVQLCVKVVEHHGLLTVGVYRIPGNTAAVNSLIGSLDKGFENTDFNDPRWRDVNVVSSLLKAFLRKLPDPLLTDNLYEDFIEANRISEHAQRLRKMRQLLEKLPKTNYETMKYLILHLRRVVASSHINKMEARNLALMFGPSLVRPSGESMATMVTHMSDQCKIIESLILYCDYMFACENSSGDVPPGPLPIEYARDDFANTSFADINDLLRRVSKTEEELEKTKDNIVKSIWKARRGGSRKAKAVNGYIGEEPSNVSSSSSLNQTPVNGHVSRENSHVNLHNFDINTAPLFNERNIDEEITRRKPSAVEQTPKDGSACSSVVVTTTSRAVESPQQQQVSPRASNEFSQLAEEMRRRREENIYTARRIFIAGADAQVGLQGTQAFTSTSPTPSSPKIAAAAMTSSSTSAPLCGVNSAPTADVDAKTAAKMDVLVQHSRHLNINNNLQTLDVLSPETREKIRRFQLDSQMLTHKSRQQAAQLIKVESERLKIEQQCEQAKRELEQDDYLDALADNPRILMRSTTVDTTATTTSTTDNASITSDYSTTSSNFAGSDQQATIGCHGNGVAANAMSQSFNGQLPSCSSDYSSQSSPQQVYDRNRLKHLNPESSFLARNYQQATAAPQQDETAVPIRRHVVARSQTSNAVLSARRAKAWYEENDVDASFIVHLKEQQNGAAVDVAKGNKCVTKCHDVSPGNGKLVRIASIDEQPPLAHSTPTGAASASTSAHAAGGGTPSRIGQKIKFRSKSSSADKRKDSRRHTLGNFADMEAIKTAIFGTFGGKASTSSAPPMTTTENSQALDNHNNSQNNNNQQHHHHKQQSRAGKFKAWFKESFRRSSPDLIEDENLETVDNR